MIVQDIKKDDPDYIMISEYRKAHNIDVQSERIRCSILAGQEAYEAGVSAQIVANLIRKLQ